MANNFLFYSNYYAYALEAGINRANSILPAIAVSTRVDVTTVTNKRNVDSATANMTRAFDMGYEYLWIDAQDRSPLQDAFQGLAQYVLDENGIEVNTLLESEGIQVKPLYATLANIYGEEIEDSNIEES